MDNHPIPQDVTNFQFRLIGDMTIKQFAYIVASVILGWIFLASPFFSLLKLLLAGVAVFSGVVLAFIPIEGRPSDVMILHFIKALFSPTQFLYQKSGVRTFSPQAPKEEKTKEVSKAPEKEQIISFAPTATAAVQAKKEEATPVAPPTAPQQSAVLQKEVAQITQALTTAKQEEAKEKGSPQAVIAHEKVTDLEKELQEVMQQKQELERQLIALQKSLTQTKQEVFSPSAKDIPQETQHVKKIPKQMSAGAGAPLVPDVPNLITGIVKDPRGNVLNNMLIEVKDKDGNPVRAFKTNQLGQFAFATPLLNGTYTITFEDPAGKQSFDSVEIVASGDILSPLEITSVDARERLRQELFSPAT